MQALRFTQSIENLQPQSIKIARAGDGYAPAASRCTKAAVARRRFQNRTCHSFFGLLFPGIRCNIARAST
jgi:hypothetical protein